MLDDTTFLIKSFLRPDLMLRAVGSVRATYPQARVLVVDDGDADLEVLAQAQDIGARLLLLPFDTGLSEGRNAGVRIIDTTYVVVMDDDMVVTPATNVPAMLQMLDIADICCATMRQNGHLVPWEGYYEFPNDGGLRLVPHSGNFETYRGVRYIDVDFGLNVFASRTAFLREHPWDPLLKIVEHTDFFLRLKGKGRVVFTPDSVFNHKPERGPQYRKMRRRPEFRLRFFAKHDLKYHIGYSGHVDRPSLSDRRAIARIKETL